MPVLDIFAGLAGLDNRASYQKNTIGGAAIVDCNTLCLNKNIQRLENGKIEMWKMVLESCSSNSQLAEEYVFQTIQITNKDRLLL